ncbi:transposase [Thiothrix eikelboomii]|uniref:transposase n=1 Tax=Thiothrix eikelboomii TaxID=92487 RepID=UPI003BB200C4
MVDSGKLRFIVIDGSTVQEPEATATTYRLHIAIDLINLSLHQVEVTTDKEGENLDHYTLAAGDVVLIDRGYNQPKTLVPFIDRGGDVVLRYNAHGMNLYEDGTGEESGRMVKIDWYTRLHLFESTELDTLILTNGLESLCVEADQPVHLGYNNEAVAYIPTNVCAICEA